MMKKVRLSEEAYNNLKKRLTEEVDPFYDVRTAFEDFKAAFDQCAVETSEYSENGKALHPFLKEIGQNINFDAIESILYGK
jgi:hypothetical protein